MLTVSVLEFRAGCWDSVKQALAAFDEIEIHGVDDNRALVLFDTDGETSVDEICEKLNSCEDIITISHQSFYFDEEDKDNMPPLEELFKKRRN